MIVPGDSMEKIGRNDPCPCGSGKKYKKCCMSKEQQENKISKGAKPKVIPGLWTYEMLPKKELYDSIEEFFDELRSTGRVPIIISENERDDEEFGYSHTIEAGELCRHGYPCGGSATFKEIDGKWEWIESGETMAPPCVVCDMQENNIEIGCPGCGIALPDFSEEEILQIHESRTLPIDIICPNCGSRFFQEDDEGLKITPPRKSKDESQ